MPKGQPETNMPLGITTIVLQHLLNRLHVSLPKPWLKYNIRPLIYGPCEGKVADRVFGVCADIVRP